MKISSNKGSTYDTAVDYCMAHVLRIRHFLLGQGYKVAKRITILQDNQSTILLEHNGILSSSKRKNIWM